MEYINTSFILHKLYYRLGTIHSRLMNLQRHGNVFRELRMCSETRSWNAWLSYFKLSYQALKKMVGIMQTIFSQNILVCNELSHPEGYEYQLAT